MSHPQTRRWSNETRRPNKGWSPMTSKRSLPFKTVAVLACLLLVYWGSIIMSTPQVMRLLP